MSETVAIKRSSRSVKRDKNSQIPLGLLLGIFIIALGCYWFSSGTKLGIAWFMGIAFGFVLQRSRFCFTASLRDPCISGSTTITRAVLTAFALTSIGFGALKFASAGKLDMMSVNPIGLPLAVGAILFGIGMVIAGGCASGTVMRVGEGFTMQILVLVFFCLGSLWGAHDAGSFWYPMYEGMPAIYLPQVFGWGLAIIIQFAIILLLYLAAVKWQAKKMGSA